MEIKQVKIRDENPDLSSQLNEDVSVTNSSAIAGGATADFGTERWSL
jgi:hypothetical protein